MARKWMTRDERRTRAIAAEDTAFAKEHGLGAWRDRRDRQRAARIGAWRRSKDVVTPNRSDDDGLFDLESLRRPA